MTQTPALPGSLLTHPRLGDWLRIESTGTVAVFSGKVEIGQGITTALAQMVADELDVAMERVRMMTVATDRSPDEGYTAGSMSVERSGAALRQVCAEVRALLLEEAASVLGVAAADLGVEDGVIGGAGETSTMTYWDLAASVSLDRDAAGAAVPKPSDHRRLIGTSVARADIAGKISGARIFVHDLAPPGMVHGRVIRPPSPGARLRPVGDAGAALADDVTVVNDGDFLAVIAPTEFGALRAADDLRAAVTWDERPGLPDGGDDGISRFLRGGRLDDQLVDQGLSAPDGETAGSAGSVQAT